MRLRGIKPTTIEKRLKCLFYGTAGVGKSTAAIQFPKPYIIDTEKGVEQDQYVRMIDEAEGALFQTCDFDELMNEVKALLTIKHDYKTLVIDPLTPIYSDLLMKSANSRITSKDPDGTSYGGHYADANKKINHLLRLLSRLDMNVIITSHSKNEVQMHGKEMVITGQTFDCYKKLDYLFDLVFEIQKRGKERIALVKKTRVESFGDGEVFAFNYQEIAKRYGKNVIEKESVSEILATNDQLSDLNNLIDLLKVPGETIQKWLDKSNSEKLDEMKTEDIQKCIDYLSSKINYGNILKDVGEKLLSIKE